MPSLGNGSKGDVAARKAAIENRAAELNTNGSMLANKSEYDTLTRSLGQQQVYSDNLERSLSNAEDGFKQITTAFSGSGINPTQSQFANSKINDVNKLFGNNTTALRAFQAGLTEVQNEYAQVFARGGSRSVEGNKEAADLMSGDLSIKDLIGIQNELQAQGAINTKGSQDQISKINDQINHILSPASLKSSNVGATNDYLDSTQAKLSDPTNSYLNSLGY